MGTQKNVTVKDLEKHFQDYKKECKDNPRFENCYTARTNDFKAVPREKPLTMNGFEIYLRKEGVLCKLDDYLSNKDDRYSNYAAILHAIKQEIYEDKLTGAVVGIYQHNIIARELGLVDKKEMDVKTEQPLFPDEKK